VFSLARVEETSDTNIELPNDLKDHLSDFCKENGTTRKFIVRRLLELFFFRLSQEGRAAVLRQVRMTPAMLRLILEDMQLADEAEPKSKPRRPKR
jgi:hypothetical protein